MKKLILWLKKSKHYLIVMDPPPPNCVGLTLANLNYEWVKLYFYFFKPKPLITVKTNKMTKVKEQESRMSQRRSNDLLGLRIGLWASSAPAAAPHHQVDSDSTGFRFTLGLILVLQLCSNHCFTVRSDVTAVAESLLWPLPHLSSFALQP